MPYLFEALRDISDLALGASQCRLLEAVEANLSAACFGAITHLRGPIVSAHIGVLASPESCRAVTVRLLGVAPGRAPTEQVVRGAMAELSYLLAGGVRRRLGSFGSVSVGQPTFLAGRVEERPGWRLKELQAEVDGIGLTLVCATRNDAVFAAVTHRAHRARVS